MRFEDVIRHEFKSGGTRSLVQPEKRGTRKVKALMLLLAPFGLPLLPALAMCWIGYFTLRYFANSASQCHRPNVCCQTGHCNSFTKD